MVERSLTVRWVVGSIPRGEHIELFLTDKTAYYGFCYCSTRDPPRGFDLTIHYTLSLQSITELERDGRGSIHGAMGCRIDPSMGPLNYFSFQQVLHNWCNKGRGMCYPVYEWCIYKNPCTI